MKLQDLLEKLRTENTPLPGTYPLKELLRYVSSRRMSGFAEEKAGGHDLYLAFIEGDPEGALYSDEKGVLFGDKAVLMITGAEIFTLTEVKGEVIESLVMSSRIFDTNRLKKSTMNSVPEIGRSGGGIGVLSVAVLKNGVPANGIRVSIRKDGKIVGSDVTTSEGNVGFRVAYSDYDCILQDRSQAVTRCRISFDEAHPSVKISI
jgi:hypothetical protein